LVSGWSHFVFWRSYLPFLSVPKTMANLLMVLWADTLTYDRFFVVFLQ
jgi:hypothetical protein